VGLIEEEFVLKDLDLLIAICVACTFIITALAIVFGVSVSKGDITQL